MTSSTISESLALAIEKCTYSIIEGLNVNQALVQRGILHDMSGDYDNAIVDYKEAISLKSNSPDLYYLCAYSQKQQNVGFNHIMNVRFSTDKSTNIMQ